MPVCASLGHVAYYYYTVYIDVILLALKPTKRLAHANYRIPNCCKRFTYVAKTRANLTTYSRKPENYNGTIIFEIDIMKNSSPINLNLCQT